MDHLWQKTKQAPRKDLKHGHSGEGYHNMWVNLDISPIYYITNDSSELYMFPSDPPVGVTGSGPTVTVPLSMTYEL